MRRGLLVLVVALVGMTASPASAQDVPELEPGVAVYVPLVDSIIVDGDLSDWSGLPTVVTSTGPSPAPDPSNTGSVTWQIAAVGETLVFSATIPDATIVAGEHGENYWNEDSLELYVNFSGDLQASSYGSGIAQITFSPIDIGNTDPSALTITGTNASDFTISGYVFATTDGWGVEVGVNLDGLVIPSDLGEFGLQVQANGSRGGDRDTKLIWSAADVDDSSFNNPAVFGTGIFLDDASGAESDEVPGNTSEDAPIDAGGDSEQSDALVIDPSIDAPVDEVITDEIGAPPLDPSESGSRGLLVAAVFAAAAIMAGSFLFEYRRSAKEQKRAAAESHGIEQQLALNPPEPDRAE
ncbi:MAG: sugar-binding protein [Acidimicrobiia bacterium]|nr:sugar-binding protein [Acidimicrobiia bacterium]